MPKNIYRIVISFVLVAAVLVLAMPRTPEFGYDYGKGKRWQYESFFAPFDFPILKTEEQIAQERYARSGAGQVPYYRYSSETSSGVLRNIAALNLSTSEKTVILSSLDAIYEKGVMIERSSDSNGKTAVSEVIYIQKDKRAVKYPVTEVFTLAEARNRLLSDVQASEAVLSADSLLRSSGIYDILQPNLEFDRQTTELVNANALSSVSTTDGYISAGQLIVTKGELVTAELEQVLDSCKAEYESTMGYSGPHFLMLLGCIIMAISISGVLFLCIYLMKPKIFNEPRFYYVLLVFVLFSAMTLIVARLREDLLYCIPYTLVALYLQAFFRPKLIIPVYMITLLPLLVFTDNGLILFVMYLVSGLLSVYLFDFLGRGWKQLVAAMVNFCVVALIYMAFHWMDLVHAEVLRILAYLFVASIFQFFGYPLIYVFERLFNLVSNSRLIELGDMSNTLVRELERKAPGTFQHSLQVMSMADSAARVIGANPLLVRVGALYHDIGKTVNPQCFVENESLVDKTEENKYHFGLPSVQSAHDIIRHVSDGVELARQHHLPEKVCDFILTHHGTTVTSFFYNKFINEGGSDSEIDLFRYDGKKPFTKEQVILMLCDSVEAASRTLRDYSPKSCSAFVDHIVAGKIAEGQFENADITIHDLGLVKQEISNYLANSHHERIDYPKRNKTITGNERKRKQNR